MLLELEKSCLLLVDVQQKLTPLVKNSEQLVANCGWLLELAQTLEVPRLVTEQYPKGLGHTVEALQIFLKNVAVHEKQDFSVCADQSCHTALQSLNRSQIVVMGIETSVCILQTVMQLLKTGQQVYVVVDAVSARHEIDHQLALKRMKKMGATLITKEMVLFEWLRSAAHPKFKELSLKFLR